MKRRIILYILSLALVLSFSGCGKDETESTVSVTNVEVKSAKTGDIQSTVSYTGDVKAATAASVSPKVSGAVKAIYVEIGDYVTAGDTLMSIDSAQYQLSYNQAKAAYNSANAAYNNVKNGSNAQSEISMNQSVSSAQINYDTALDNYNRQKALFDIGAISRVALDSAKSALDNAKIALDTALESQKLNSEVISPQSEASAKAGVDQAKAALDIASYSLANCNVKAPISGYITSKNVLIGQTVSQGIEAFSIKNSDALEIEISVTEAVIASVQEGTKSKINIKSAGVENAEGIITAAGQAKNAATGMFTVKIAVPNTDKNIKDGMIADVVLTTGEAADVLVISKDSLLTSGEETYVYIAKDGVAVKAVVETGLSDEEYIEVVSGLKEGDEVITEGKEFLSEKNNAIKITSNE